MTNKNRSETENSFASVENIVEKGENNGYQHFLLFPQCFLEPCSLWLLQQEIVMSRVTYG